MSVAASIAQTLEVEKIELPPQKTEGAQQFKWHNIRIDPSASPDTIKQALIDKFTELEIPEPEGNASDILQEQSLPTFRSYDSYSSGIIQELYPEDGVLKARNIFVIITPSLLLTIGSNREKPEAVERNKSEVQSGKLTENDLKSPYTLFLSILAASIYGNKTHVIFLKRQLEKLDVKESRSILVMNDRLQEQFRKINNGLINLFEYVSGTKLVFDMLARKTNLNQDDYTNDLKSHFEQIQTFYTSTKEIRDGLHQTFLNNLILRFTVAAVAVTPPWAIPTIASIVSPASQGLKVGSLALGTLIGVFLYVRFRKS